MIISKATFRPRRGNVIFNIQDRWIKLFGPINQATVIWFAKFVHATNLANYLPIFVFIDSPGGDTNATLVIYSMLVNSIAPVITVVYRKAHSGAFILFQAGCKRLMFKKSQLVFHWCAFDIQKNYAIDIQQLEAMRKNLLVTNQRLYRIIKRRSQLPLELVKKFFAEEKVLSAKEAKKYNLTDEIVNSRKKFIANMKFGN